MADDNSEDVKLESEPRSSELEGSGAVIPPETGMENSDQGADNDTELTNSEGVEDGGDKNVPDTPDAVGGGTAERSWDFSNRKVVIKNMAKFANPRRLKKQTDGWLKAMGGKVKFSKVKKPSTTSFAVITLEDESMVEIFVNYINSTGIETKNGQTLYAHRVDPKDTGNDGSGGTGMRKRNNDNNDNQSDSNKRQRKDENAVPRVVTEEETKDALIPLWKSSYEETLNLKMQEMIKRCAIRIIKEIKDKFRILEKEAKRDPNREKVKMFPWLQERQAINILPILPSQSMVRNKVEFTFGYRYESTMESNDPQQSTDDGNVAEDPEAKKESISNNLKKIPSVGAMTRGWKSSISKPHACNNIPSEALALADILEEFLADCPMPPYDAKNHRGFWRTITIRSSRRTRQCMIIIVHAPVTGGIGSQGDGVEDENYSDVFESEKKRLVSMLSGKDLPMVERGVEDAAGSPTVAEQSADGSAKLQVTSIFFQEFEGLSTPSPSHPVQHVYGEKSLQERLGNCTFQISPGAFFQVNTPTAETLYNVVVEKVRDVTTDPQNTLCLDVCCGTGTIGLTLMKEGAVGRVVGVDISEPAIEDAIINAELNGYGKNGEAAGKARFVAAKAEDVVGTELSRARSAKRVIAVVDPAREGLHGDVVKYLRNCAAIQRIVYVSCNPTGSLLKDAACLCQPATKKFRGTPFRPTFAQPVDMFPYSKHCEMVMVFDRMDGQD